MKDYLILAILAAAAVLGILAAVRHFKGRGGCCGGGGYTPKRKKLKNVLYKKTFTVVGMHCTHCKNRVEESINGMKGLSGRVDLKRGELTVSYAQKTDDSLIIARIKKAGYTVTGFRH